MNLKAAELGCTDTVFETPNGLDKGNHHSTARDMALITRYALQNDDFARLVATPSASFQTNRLSYSFANKDRLLSEYEGALGVKTGFTCKAGQCFAGAARRGEVGLVSVVLASGWGARGKEQKWVDTKSILNYGFENYAYHDIVTENMPVGNVAVERGNADSVGVVARDCVRLLTSEEDEIELKYDIPQSIKAPVKADERIGTVNVYINGDIVAQSGAVTAQNVDKSGFKAYIEDIFDIFVSNCMGNVI
jgi:D-alanyl-D-alanine carboxypeptidase (penicillin-binding protein 5/6)